LTIWGAMAAFEEDLKGSLAPGKLADLVVLDRDLMAAPEDEIFQIKVLMTMVGGMTVFQKEATTSVAQNEN
jgi:predicted amidohydrolase YtcJ